MTALYRWKAKTKVRPKVKDKRIVRRFLLLPKCIDGEWRWLGVEPIRQECFLGYCSCPDGPVFRCLKWRDIAWVEDRKDG